MGTSIKKNYSWALLVQIVSIIAKSVAIYAIWMILQPFGANLSGGGAAGLVLVWHVFTSRHRDDIAKTMQDDAVASVTSMIFIVFAVIADFLTK